MEDQSDRPDGVSLDEDGEGPAMKKSVWDWLVVFDDPDWPVPDRIEYAKSVGRYDVVDALEGPRP